MSDNLYIKVWRRVIEDDPHDTVYAGVVWGGRTVLVRSVQDVGEIKKYGTTESTAISQVQTDFSRLFLTDIRREVKQDSSTTARPLEAPEAAGLRRQRLGQDQASGDTG